jgi:hypothetical protein
MKDEHCVATVAKLEEARANALANMRLGEAGEWLSRDFPSRPV